jgi:hypothetical protein
MIPYHLPKVQNTNLEHNQIKRDAFYIAHIQDASEEAQLLAVSKNGTTIRFIPNPSIEVQLEAIKNNVYSIIHIKFPHFQVIDLVLSIEPRLKPNIDHLPQDEQNFLKLKYDSL